MGHYLRQRIEGEQASMAKDAAVGKIVSFALFGMLTTNAGRVSNNEYSVNYVYYQSNFALLYQITWTVRARTNHVATSGSKLSKRGIIKLVCVN